MPAKLRPPNENALLEALRRAAKSEESGDGMTGTELKGLMGWGECRIRQALRRLLKEGVLEVCTLTRLRMDGVVTRINGYRLRGKPGKAMAKGEG